MSTLILHKRRPNFYFRTTDITGVCLLPEGAETVMPGADNRNDGS